MASVPTVRPLVRRIGRLRQQLRGPGDVVLFARVAAVAAMVPLFTRLSLSRQAAVLSPKPRGGRRGGDVERVVRCLDLAQDVARPLVRHGCLVRGITLYWFLGRFDDEIELCFGLGHPDTSDDYAGHCWLNRRGEPFLERVDPTASFGVVFRIPAIHQ